VDVAVAIQAGLLALSTIAAFLTVRQARNARDEEATARRNEFERDRLLDRERRLSRVADRIVDFAEVWAAPVADGAEYEHDLRQQIVRMRLQAAYEAVGYSLPATRTLITGENMRGAYIDLAREALAEVGSNLNGLATASLLPPPSEYFVPQRRRPRPWWRRDRPER
jgi:hypothetical protein